MPEPVVKCGCGRTMQPEYRAGRGTYRCGCGARVQITIPAQRPVPGCVGTYDGEPCRMVVTIEHPFRLCAEHFRTSGLSEYATWRHGAPDDIRQEISRRALEQFMKAHRADIEALDERLGVKQLEGHIVRRDAKPVVYFIRCGAMVKIGTTIDVVARIKNLNNPQLVLLATEEGYYKRERQLHRQFAELRIEREWFRLEGPLVDHIDQVRATHGLPAIQVDKVIPTP